MTSEQCSEGSISQTQPQHSTTNYYLLYLHQQCTPRTRISYILMLATEAGLTAPIHIRPRSAPVKLDAPPPSRSAPHKLDLQPQYGIRPTIAWTHRPLPDPPHTNWTYSPNTGFAPLSLGRTAPFQIRPTQIGLTAPIRDSPLHRPNPHSPQSTFAPIHPTPVKLDAPPPSRSVISYVRSY